MYYPMHLHTTLLPLQMGRKIILLSLTVTSRGGGAKRKVKRKTKQEPDKGATSKFGSWNLYRPL